MCARQAFPPQGGRWHGEAVTDEGAGLWVAAGEFRRSGGGFLSERSERNQRIAGGRLSLDAARPNSPYPRIPVYGGRALLALWSRPARVISGRLLLLTRCRSPQSPGRVLLFVYAAPGWCNIHPFCRGLPDTPCRGGPVWPPGVIGGRSPLYQKWVAGGFGSYCGGFRRRGGGVIFER